jgi:hypothetical protein
MVARGVLFKPAVQFRREIFNQQAWHGILENIQTVAK